MKLSNLLLPNLLLSSAFAYLDVPLNSKKRLVKRADGSVDYDLKNRNDYYSIELILGTPGQKVSVVIDTGSSDFWVMGKGVNCTIPKESDGGKCDSIGVFDYEKSSTYKNNGTYFFASYGDSSMGSGNWSKDVVDINGVKVEDVNFAVANVSNSTSGILGIGLITNESGNAENTENGTDINSVYYPNFPVQLMQQGIIKKLVYSLYLNKPDAKRGSILFGGVDHSKYSGNLYTVPIVNPEGDGAPTDLLVQLFGLGLTDKNERTTLATTNIPVLLDSGTTNMMLPKELLDSIAEKVNATYNATTEEYSLACDGYDDMTLDFDLGGFPISVPIKTLILKDSGKCTLNFDSSDGGFPILGDLFLRYAYVVYDLDDYEISLAQALEGAKISGNATIEEVVSTIPSAIRAPMYSSVTNGTSSLTVSTGGNIYTAAAYQTTSSSKSGSKNYANNINCPSYKSIMWSLLALLM